MKIVMLSDLHISQQTDVENRLTLISKMAKHVKPLVAPKEKIMIICCGDIVDRGETEAFWHSLNIEPRGFD